MRKINILVIGLILAVIGLYFTRIKFYQQGLQTGRVVCTDILNNCANHCREWVKEGAIK